ncbi:hypothetical protein WMF20_15700 [Sorangium sp. So ce834]
MVELAARDEREEVGGGGGVVVAAEEQPRLPRNSDGSQSPLARVVLQAQAAVVEEAPQGLLLVEGVAERGGDQAALAGTRVLGLDPGEERVDQGADGRVAAHLALRWREIRQRAIGGEQGIDPAQPLDAELVLADRRLPEVGAAMRPASDLGRRRSTSLVGRSAPWGRAAEEGVIDRVGVRLDVSREAAEHLADRGAGMLGLVLEEDVILVREDDEEVSFAARSWLLVLALLDGPGLDGDPGGVRGEAEGGLEGLFPRGLDDGAQGRAHIFGVPAHRAAIERRPLKLQLLLQPIERDTEQVLAGEDVRDDRRREKRPPEQLLRKRRRDEDRAGLTRRRRRRRVESCGRSARVAGRGRVLRADAHSGRRRRDFFRDDLERGSFPLARAARIRDGPFGLVHDACEHDAAHASTLVAESRGLLDPDARRRRIELGTGELDADDGQVGLGQVAAALAAGPSFRPLGVVVLPLVAALALGGIQGLFEALDLEEHRVERELLRAHLGALRLRHEQAAPQQLELLERMRVGAPELRERVARSHELTLRRGELRFELRDALLLGRPRRLVRSVVHGAALRAPIVLVEQIRRSQ